MITGSECHDDELELLISSRNTLFWTDVQQKALRDSSMPDAVSIRRYEIMLLSVGDVHRSELSFIMR